MNSRSAAGETPVSGSSKITEGNKWRVPFSTVVSHFGTSGVSVAAATGITHPLAAEQLIFNFLSELLGLDIGYLFRCAQSEAANATSWPERSLDWNSLYEPSKYVCELAFESTNILVKIASGTFSGAVATALTNPVEVLKVRLQMSVNSSRGPIYELKRIFHEEGIAALWKGLGPAMSRAAALTASQLATYDETKQALIKWTPLEEGFQLHLISSTIAGAVSTLITAPVDMVKTRLMLQRESKQVGMYRNGFHCAGQVLRSEGARGLYKGGLALFARLGPQTTITFILCEKLRELAGLKAI